jgi:pimeloyl-ACP methyl ester carboxylesterase
MPGGVARPTVVLLHGSAASGAAWNGIRTEIGPEFHLVTPDLIGYGRSAPWHRGEPFEIDDEVDHLAAQLGTVLSAPVHLMGHSYGGLVAMALAEQHPRWVRSLTLVEPVALSLLSRVDADALARLTAARQHFEALLESGLRRLAAEGFISFWADSESWVRMAETERASITDRLEKIRLDWNIALTLPHTAASLERLAPLTTLVRGERTLPPMAVLTDALHAAMPGSRLRIVYGADHSVPLTHHAELAEILREIVRRSARGGPC